MATHPCTDAVFSWGHHYVTYNTPAIEPCGQAKPNAETFRLLAERMGLDDPCFRETDEETLASLFADSPGGVTLDDLRERGWVKIDLGQGPVPHAHGGFGTAWRMAMDPEMAAEGFTHLTHEIEEIESGVTRLTVIHDLSSAPLLANLLAGGLESTGAGGGWSWVLSDLKSLLETGTPLAG